MVTLLRLFVKIKLINFAGQIKIILRKNFIKSLFLIKTSNFYNLLIKKKYKESFFGKYYKNNFKEL